VVLKGTIMTRLNTAVFLAAFLAAGVLAAGAASAQQAKPKINAPDTNAPAPVRAAAVRPAAAKASPEKASPEKASPAKAASDKSAAPLSCTAARSRVDSDRARMEALMLTLSSEDSKADTPQRFRRMCALDAAISSTAARLAKIIRATPGSCLSADDKAAASELRRLSEPVPECKKAQGDKEQGERSARLKDGRLKNGPSKDGKKDDKGAERPVKAAEADERPARRTETAALAPSRQNQVGQNQTAPAAVEPPPLTRTAARPVAQPAGQSQAAPEVAPPITLVSPPPNVALGLMSDLY
jgi:hypothetical protein